MLEIVGIRKNFVNSAEPALDGIDLAIREGECLALLGPSGCGKTTLLRILAGLEAADKGQIRLDGRVLISGAHERPFHMVFQRHALFPHLTVFENVAFGLRLRKVATGEIETRVREALALVRLQGFENRRPATLSGGQSQRVALARALVNRPRVLLLDEPFSALDLKLREGMATELRDLQKQLRLTFVFVTHDQQEAFALSDRVALMRQGRIEQIGTPEQIYQKPAGLFAARFVGQVTELPVTDPRPQSQGLVLFQCAGENLAGFCPEFSTKPNGWRALVRPEAFGLRATPEAANRLRVKIRDWTFKGSSVLVRAEGPAQTQILMAFAPAEAASFDLQPKKTCEVYFRPADTWLCPLEDKA